MFARTRRLTLRPGWPEDAPALAAAIGHYAVIGKLAHVPWPYERHHAEAFLARRDPASHVMLVEAHDLGERPQLIGGIGLHPDDDEPGRLQLGYWLTPPAWGRGYATEAARQMVSVARDCLGQPWLAAYHHHDNPASGGVLRKLGFVETGRAVRVSAARAGAVDCVTFRLPLRPDRPAALAA